MKLFVLLTFCLTFLSSETENLTKESCENCKATLPKKHVENELKAILHKVKSYKREKNQQITTLKEKLSSLNKTFNHYKATKKHEILQLKKRQINSPSRVSLKSKNRKIKELQHQLALLKKQLSQKKKVIISLKKQLSQKNQPFISTTIQEDTPKQWIKIIVNNDLNIYDLALRYYGDSLEYEKIYMANQDKIDKNYQIKNGMSLKIPITENFIEQPIFVNTAN